VSLYRWVFKWRLKVRMFRTVERQQVESSMWMEQQQKKRDGPVRGTTSVRASDLYSAFRSAGNTEALDAAQED